MILGKILKEIENRFALFVLELKFRQMESKEARAIRTMIEDLEED